ncbi:MAG: hypothetical protein AB7I27_11340 [Bacteriovoracaceae bacterium]
MKPISLNQLLFHPKTSTLSFFISPLEDEKSEKVDHFIEEIVTQLNDEHKTEMSKILSKNKTQIKKILASHSDKSHGFFISDKLQGYIILDGEVESYFMIGQSFHVRPLLEELFINPEYMVVNISLYDIKVYRGDFQHLEIIQQYEFDQIPDLLNEGGVRLYSQKTLIPYKTRLALKTIALKIQDLMLYHSMPVIITGLIDMKSIFINYFYQSNALILLEEDFFEKTCVEILEVCKDYRSQVMDYYSAQLKERLLKMLKSKRFLTDLEQIIKATMEGKVVHLILPSEKKLWGMLNMETGEFEIHKKILKSRPSIDILNELAEEVIKQGGRIQILGPHFFPEEAHVLAMLKGK